jgi:hypothetical protein
MKHTKTFEMFTEKDLPESVENFLFILPLVQMAWAHGAVSPREKQLIFAAAREDSIDERDPLNLTLDNLLSYQPSREFFDDCLSLIGENLNDKTVKQRSELRGKIIERCRAVAASAGEKSPMDLNHHISSEERNLLEKLNDILP